MSSEEIIEGVEQYLYSDGQADNILLIEGLTLVSKVATTLLSILTGIIIIGLPLIVAVEIIYINFPVVQRPINTKIIYKTGRIHRILAFALRDAVRAVEECEIEPSKNVNFEYLKLKIKALLICGIIISLGFGGASFFVQFIQGLFSGVLRVIRNALL